MSLTGEAVHCWPSSTVPFLYHLMERSSAVSVFWVLFPACSALFAEGLLGEWLGFQFISQVYHYRIIQPIFIFPGYLPFILIWKRGLKARHCSHLWFLPTLWLLSLYKLVTVGSFSASRSWLLFLSPSVWVEILFLSLLCFALWMLLLLVFL